MSREEKGSNIPRFGNWEKDTGESYTERFEIKRDQKQQSPAGTIFPNPRTGLAAHANIGSSQGAMNDGAKQESKGEEDEDGFLFSDSSARRSEPPPMAGAPPGGGAAGGAGKSHFTGIFEKLGNDKKQGLPVGVSVPAFKSTAAVPEPPSTPHEKVEQSKPQCCSIL
eukprot:TRINITY_DN1238_c0_g1_i1.p2 TRINITY_DN1238_c0_g1~~TRINITY_DN1238_c0_g1_i1.p2  ORF type:complete len:167 (-),score=39.12 TRINITY_DN1238_c0_g1_i1:319-819(-)